MDNLSIDHLINYIVCLHFNDDNFTIGELLELSDNVYSVDCNMFIGEDVTFIYNNQIYL